MDKKNGNKIIGTALLMAIITMASKVLGLLRDILVASSYGTDMEATAYTTASTLPITMFDFIIGGVVTAAFIPVFNEILVKENKEKALEFANSYINLILIITTVITVIGVVFAPALISLMAPALESETIALAVRLTRIMFPMIIFTGLAFSFVGILQSFGEFRIPALISLISNFIMVAYLMSLDRFFGIIGLAVAMLIGWSSQAFVQMPKLHSLGYRYSLKCDFKSPYVKKSAMNALPILLSSWTQPICNFINTRFASEIENGRAITALGYANKLYIVIVGVFTFVATNLLFPHFSKSNAEGNTENSKSLLHTSIKVLIFIIAPIAIGIIVLAEPFIALVYQRNEFTYADTLMTAEAIRCYAVGMLFMAINEVLIKLFFASDKTKIPMATSIVSMAVNIIIVTLFSKYLGVGGIALASGVAIAVSCIINAIAARKLGYLDPSVSDIIDVIKSFAAATVMGISVYFTAHFMKGCSGTLILFVGIAVGVAIYAVASFSLHSEEMRFIKDKLFKRKGH